MTEEADCSKKPDESAAASAEATADARRLPTLQRNALRKLLNRPEFTPEEVFELGYRRIQRAEGIGEKGLQCVLSWLKAHDLELQPPAPPPDLSLKLPAEVKRNINGAVRLLRTHGYRVRRVQGKRFL
jgi:hypothetical protein